jgi:predicted glycosyltransferase
VAQSISKSNNLTASDLANLNRKEPKILVSVGGGRLGYELLEATIAASSILRDRLPHHIQIFTGPFMPEEQFITLQQAALNRSNVTLQRYTTNLLAYMKQADISISLTGYNTTMNILRTGVRSLVVPIGHYDNDKEQLVRTNKLEKLGIVEVIDPSELTPEHLAQRIVSCLKQPSLNGDRHSFDLQGAEKTTLLLKDLWRSDRVLEASTATLFHS